MAAYTTAPSRRAKEFFDAVIHEYGIREGNHVRIPMRQCELAQRKQLAASTIGSYLSSLGPSVVSRHPHIVIALVDKRREPEHRTVQPANSHDLVEAYASLVSAQARVIELLARPAAEPREETANPREVREESARFTYKEGEEDLSSFPHDEPREESARIREELREETEVRVAAIDAVLAPLHAVASERQLKPMNNRAGVLTALRPFTVDDIAHAVGRLMALIETGDSPVSSPFGLLVQWARSGDRTHFAEPPPCRDKGSTIPSAQLRPAVEPEHAADPGDVAAVTAMEAAPESFADELDQLDQLVTTAHPHLAAHGIRPAMRHALRVAAFRDWINDQHTAGTPPAPRADDTGTTSAHQQHTAGTPQAHPQHTARTPAVALTDTHRTPAVALTDTHRTPNGALA